MNNKKGAALVYVILVMVVGIILVGGMMTTSLSENKQSIYQTNSMKAYYIARAGADSMIHRLLTIDKQYWDDFTTQHTTDSTNFGDGSFVVNVLRTGDDFEVVSTGTYNGVQNEVTAILKYNPYTKMDYAIFAKESLVNLSFDDINGPIGSGGSIAFGNHSDESSYRPLCHESSPFNPEIDMPDFSEVLTDIKPLTPPYTSINISGNGDVATTSDSIYYQEVQVTHNGAKWIIDTTNPANFYYKKINSSNELEMVDTYSGITGKWMVVFIKDPSVIAGEIEVIGNNNLMLVFEDAMAISGPITLTGSGNVEIYLTDTSDDTSESAFSPSIRNYDFSLMTSSSVIGDSSNPNRIIIYLEADTTMNFDTNGTLYGYIVGPDADVSLKNGGTMLVGALYANIAEVTASVEIDYVPPNDSNPIRVESIQFAYWE